MVRPNLYVERRSPMHRDDDEPRPKPDPMDVCWGGIIALLYGLLSAAGEEVGRRIFGRPEEEPEPGEQE